MLRSVICVWPLVPACTRNLPVLNGSERRRLTEPLSPSTFFLKVMLVNCIFENLPPSTFIGARYMWNACTEKVGVISAVPFTRADQVTASVPATDVVEPPSVTSLKMLPPAKPLNRLPSLNEPLTSVPHESLFARFLKLIV